MTQIVDPTAPYALWESAEIELAAAASVTGTSPDVMSTVERVAKIDSGMSIIDEARNALGAAGWTATITANRITVDNEVLAQLIPAKNVTSRRIHARWIIYSIAGADPIWIVGAEESSSRLTR